MSNFSTGYHKWLAGEDRTDGWRSQWRIDLERRMAEDALKPRPFVRAKEIRERQAMPQIREASKREKLPKQPVSRMACPYTGCGNSINNNSHGICSRHYSQFRGLLKQTEVRVCAEDGCFNVVLKNCTLTRCRTHAKTERRVLEALRQRKLRAMRLAA